MSTCDYCRQRKGKRFCPARNQKICSLCCGTHRQREIDCPSDCAYLAQASSQTVTEEIHSFRDLLMNPRSERQRVPLLSFEIQGVIARFRGSVMTLSDGDVEYALCDTRSRAGGLLLPMAAPFSPVLKRSMLITDTSAPEDVNGKLASELSALILETIKLNAEDPHPCTLDEQKKVLEDLIENVRLHSRGQYRSQNYLNFVSTLMRTR